jgi:hypothetical protein
MSRPTIPPTGASTPKPTRTRPRWPIIALLGVLVWTAVVLFWASQPITDHVPTGKVDNVPTNVAVECPAPWSGSSAATQPLPSLPDGEAYERDACTVAHDQAHLLFIFDLLVAVIAVGGLGWALTRTPAPDESLTAPA